MSSMNDHTAEIAQRVATFKDNAITNFLSKHGLTPDDVKPGVVSPSGYQLYIHDEPYAEKWSLTLYKVIDTASWGIKRTVDVEIKESPEAISSVGGSDE